MLGFVTLGLTAVMIYTLVKNALTGKPLSKTDGFNGRIDLIIPITARSEFFLEAWIESVHSYRIPVEQLRIHVLIDGHHPSLSTWMEMRSKIPYLEIHSFTTRPSHVEAIPWMLDQISGKINAQVVIIGDSELVPQGEAFLSAARKVVDKERSYFIVPQTAKFNVLGEAVAVLNPTLAFVSIFGSQKWRRSMSNSLLSISQGWLAMSYQTFREIDFKAIRLSNWKEAISRQWADKNKTYHLGFGERLLLRQYPNDLKGQLDVLREQWESFWNKRDRKSFWLYLGALFIWSFPIIFFPSHPFWAIASVFLLLGYRFFTKIVFQESWSALFLHPIACLILEFTFVWWLVKKLKAKRSVE